MLADASDLLLSFSFVLRIIICKLLIVKHLREGAPCVCKSLILNYLQEVSKMQATRRKIVEKSLTQKVFLLAIFDSESISFFI